MGEPIAITAGDAEDARGTGDRFNFAVSNRERRSRPFLPPSVVRNVASVEVPSQTRLVRQASSLSGSKVWLWTISVVQLLPPFVVRRTTVPVVL